ncbi:MAG: DUF2239 family protein [Rhodanobacter sp.]
MQPHSTALCTAFDGHRLIASGALANVALATKQALDAGAQGPVLIFDDRSGRTIELDFRGTIDEVMARLEPDTINQAEPDSPATRGPGRPKLGVVAREVTLLPRHWDWLNSQPGGASATLRQLVEKARRGGTAKERARLAAEAADRFMRTMAGDFPGFEEASRAFWRSDRDSFTGLIDAWPNDVRHHVQYLATVAWDEQTDND